MNKKVSTLLTLGLFMGGSLFNVVNAEKLSEFIKQKADGTVVPAEKLENGKSYFLQMGDTYLHSTLVEEDGKDDKIQYALKNAATTLDKEELKEYLWTVTFSTESNGTTVYQFKNAESGKFIYFTIKEKAETTKAGEAEGKQTEWVLSTNPEEKDGANTQRSFTWVDDSDKQVNQTEKFTAARVKAVKKGEKPDANGYFGYVGGEFAVSENGQDITMVQLADGIEIGDGSELNDLYNSAGFNFELSGDKLSDVANIFGEKNIVALNVSGEKSYQGNKKGGNYGFPQGTYFATSVPYKTTAKDLTYDYLVQCTFIAVDSDANIAESADDRKAGKGFTLTEVSGKDLVLYVGKEEKEMSAGNQISVKNAIFNVSESTTADVYELAVPHFRAVEKDGESKQKDFKGLEIVANEDASAIHTGAAGNNFIFKFAESTVEKGIAFLKEEGPAIYNIKFYLKNGNDKSYNGKYLTMDATGSKFVAKGEVLADLDAPVYQWVISKVDGSDVTFTNRENGATLVTKLFKTADGKYSLAPKSASTQEEESDAINFTYYNVTDKGDVVVAKKDDGDHTINFQGVLIELKESAAVNYSDYMNVEDGSVMTLSFGRDIAPTSNKLYPLVTENGSSYIFKDGESLTDNIDKAAQWLLVKERDDSNNIKNNAVKRNYAYKNGELVNIKNDGDVVYAYTYKLQLVLDGKAVDGEFLTLNSSSYTIGTGTPFFIQENEDGSVLLKNVRKAGEALLLSDTYKEDEQNELTVPKTIGELIKCNFEANDITIDSKATDVKTYLIAEAPAVSLPGNEGHYSIATIQGNYITMNDENDGLTVREESEPLYLYVTDTKDVVPSFYLTKAAKNKEERMFLFNPTDSINYYVGEGQYDKNYQLPGGQTKAIFKAAAINETRDTLTTNIKGVSTLVAMDANNTEKVNGGLKRFKMQIVEDPNADGMYVIRQKGDAWLSALNGFLVWGDKIDAQSFEITTAEAPTSNEGVAATEVKVVAQDGAVVVKNAAGKNVVVSTILGQVVANEVLTSDNATINVPAGIVVVSVDGESFKVNVR